MRSVGIHQREHFRCMPSLEQFQFRTITQIVFEHAESTFSSIWILVLNLEPEFS